MATPDASPGPSPSGRALNRGFSLKEGLDSIREGLDVVGTELGAVMDVVQPATPNDINTAARAPELKLPGSVNLTASSTGPPAPLAPARVQPAWVQAINKQLAKHQLSVKQILMRDKIVHCLGLLNLMVSSMLITHPTAFVREFQIKAVVLLSARWFYYRLKDWHYYMLEFCYAAILVGIVHTLWMPHDPAMYQLTFALFVGVLTPAVIATRNAFVLHSIDKMTSLFQHLTPALVAWLIRWQPARTIPGWADLTPEHQASMGRAGFVRLTLAPMGVWLVWAVVYYIIVFILAEEKVRQRGYATMFALQTKNPKSGVSKFIFSFKTRKMQYAAYMGVHGTGCMIGCITNPIWFHCRFLHTLLVLGVLCMSMWNGAGYQMHVFSKKYLAEIHEEAGTVAELEKAGLVVQEAKVA